jgi:hypothetical protein
MPGLVPGIHVFLWIRMARMWMGRDIWREDALRVFFPAMTS